MTGTLTMTSEEEQEIVKTVTDATERALAEPSYLLHLGILVGIGESVETETMRAIAKWLLGVSYEWVILQCGDGRPNFYVLWKRP